MSTPRREFLSWLGASGLYAAAGAPLASGPKRSGAPVPIATDFDMTWTDRIKGKHRAVFDSPGLGEGGAMWRAILWRKQHKTVFGTEPSEMNAVIVFRHEAIPLVMDDSYWETFKMGKETKWKDEKGKWVTANPIRAARPAPPTPPPAPAGGAPAGPPPPDDFNLVSFIASGGIVLACNLAFGDVVAHYEGEGKHAIPHADARKKAIEHLIPGVILQPSGLFAAIAAQEAGCHYVMGS